MMIFSKFFKEDTLPGLVGNSLAERDQSHIGGESSLN